MNHFKKVFISILVCAITSVSLANGNKTEETPYPDTLNIVIDDDIRLMILSDNLYRFQPGDTIDRLVEKFNNDILKIEYPFDKEKFIKILYHIGINGSSIIKFEDVTDDDRDYHILENGATFEPKPIELVMTVDKETQISFYLPGPEYFEELGSYKYQDIILTIIESGKEEMHDMRRLPVTINWWIEDGKAVPEMTEMYKNSSSVDMIALSGSVAASLVRDKLVPSIDARLGIILGKKTYQRHMFNVEASMMYIFNKNQEGSYSTDINTFLGVSYYFNPSKNTDKPRWFGVGLSYLAWQSGDFFGENTWRLTLGARFGEHFTVLPELYFGDNFNEIMPGLRMQVSF